MMISRTLQFSILVSALALSASGPVMAQSCTRQGVDTNSKNILVNSVTYYKLWRREWDSNPRYGFPHTRFPSVRLKPLGHLSGGPLLKGQD